MMNKLFNVSTMPLLGMVFLFMAACSDDADNSDPNNDIQNIEMPSSGAESPIVSGKLVVIRGNGFSENSEIWFQTSSRSGEKKADVISYSDESISFIAPNMTGNCDVILRQEGKEKTLGQMFLEEKDVNNMNDYIYAAGYNVVDFEDNENAFPILYVFDRQSGDFEKKNELPNGKIIKFILAENNGNQNIYYFKRCLPISKEVSLYKYNLAKQEEKKVCANWLNKFYNASPGMAIGMIENTLCGLEASVDKGFEIVSFDDNGKTTLLKRAFPYDRINGKYVTQFYCEDDNLLFNYDSKSRCVLVTGSIRFEDDRESFDCLLSLNMKTGDIKLLRDEQNDAYYYEVLNTKQGFVLLEIGKDIDKTIVKTINPETLETTSILAEIDKYITSAIYNEKTNSIYWESSNGTSEDYVMEYNFDSKEVSVSNTSLPYIEALFSIKY
ncbi:hypothetical protein F3B42_04060 [Bacteroides ovatus]|uniref:IPT/TIG domain-containing protein n=1 Tax=Bacteroides ovatus TaxID=28116 RepID=A0A7J4Y1Y9_BACOV|nr:hypothetical protein F3B90_04775 [Bacteroides ovatus]KAA4640778.1 hypothetical protein F3B52_06375 [Bacteroides ovatus]KAA4674965.1 hypothetical protein F3B42_04060 [Bacteroides ovatus]KAA4683901.1 hypothetical protein F3B41_04770 [Bacteroides ovatus]